MQSVIVESAAVLSDIDKKKLNDTITTLLNTKDVTVTFVVKPALLGGFLIKIGDRTVDATLKDELVQMTQALKGHINDR